MKTKRNKKAFSLLELMVVLGIVGVLAGLILPWIRGMFSMEKQSRDELTALNEQRIDEGDLKIRLTNSSIMRSGLVSCKKMHLLMKGETPGTRDLKKDGDVVDFVSSKPAGIGTVVNNSLRVTQSAGFVPGALLFLRSINGDNQQLFVRVSSVNSSTGILNFDYTFNASIPSFTSCSIQNPTNAQSYMSSFENKRFSVEIVQFVSLSLTTDSGKLALFYKVWPRQGFQGLQVLTVSDVTVSKLYDSIDNLNVEEKFYGNTNSSYGNYFVKLAFQSIKSNTSGDRGVGVAGPHSFTHIISGAYSALGLEIGNIRAGTASFVKPPNVTCSVIYNKLAGKFTDTVSSIPSNVYEVKILFSDASSVNSSTNPLNGSMTVSAVGSSDANAVRCYNSNQYIPSTKSFRGGSSKGDMALISTGGATFSDPIFCFFKGPTDISGKLTYTALLGSTARQYFPKCETIRISP